jgi:Skp family chaperone for outer membrane proteins
MKLPALLFLLVLPLTAELPRIATVDMAQVFGDLEEKKTAESQYRKALSNLSENPRVKAVEEMDAELTQLAGIVRDQTVPEDHRAQAAARFNSLSTEYTSLVTEMKRYLANERKNLTEQFVEKQEALIAKVHTVTKQLATESDYDLVLEVGGKTSSQISPIIYLSPATDITSEVMTRLEQKGNGDF